MSSLSTSQEALIHIRMAANEIQNAATAAYWLSCYSHHGENHQLETIAREFKKLRDALVQLDGAHLDEKPTGYLHLGKAGAAIAMAEDARKSEATQ